MNVPPEFWGEAVNTAVYLLNRAPTKSLDSKTPFEAWHGRKPRVSHLKTFGCTASVKLVGPHQHKLADRSRKMVFLGYETGTKGYRFYDPTTSKLVVSRDVVFNENQPWNWTNADSSADQQPGSFIVHYELSDENPTTEANQDYNGQPDAVQLGNDPTNDDGAIGNDVAAPNSPSTPEAQIQNQGWATPPNQHSENSASPDEGPVRFRTLRDLFYSTDVMHDFEYSGVCMLAADEPTNVEAALEENCWKEAMQAEMQSIIQNNT
jgi:hypothetical protein